MSAVLIALRCVARLLTAAAPCLLAACGVLSPRVQMSDTLPVLVADPAPVLISNGSLFQSASYRPLFEDHRARLAGDTLTVQIIEKISATQKSTSSVDKTGSLSAGISALPGVRPAAFARATAEGSTGNKFAGKGTTESSSTSAAPSPSSCAACCPTATC